MRTASTVDWVIFGVVVATIFGVLAYCAWSIRQAVTGRRNDDNLDDTPVGRPCLGCGYDLRGAEHDRCPECGRPTGIDDGRGRSMARFDLARLRDDWPTSPIDPVEPQPWDPTAVAHSTTNRDLANALVDHLTARGVWCSLQERDAVVASGGSTVAVTDYRVLVPASERERAEAILDRFRIRPAAGKE